MGDFRSAEVMSALGQKQTCDVMPSFGRPGQKATNLARVLSLGPIVDNWLARYPFRGSEYINCVGAARFYFPLHFFACRAVPRLKRRNALKIGERSLLACLRLGHGVVFRKSVRLPHGHHGPRHSNGRYSCAYSRCRVVAGLGFPIHPVKYVGR
jgi:hypothetical protein